MSSSGALRADEVDAAFLALRYTRALNKLGTQFLDPDYWRALNPELTISDRGPGVGNTPFNNDWASSEICQRRLREEGYYLTPKIVPVDDVVKMRTAVERIVARGLPPGCAMVYDEFYRVYASLARAAEPILGPNPILMPEDFWVFFVPAGDGAASRWTAFDPHRDWVSVDQGVMDGGLPTVLVGWVALSDASTEDSCMYVVPGDCDRGYRSADRIVYTDHFRLQDVRAVPAEAGQVLLFSSHIAHWGSRSSRWATHPRVSISVFFQRGDMPARLKDVIDLEQAVPFESRVRWVVRTMRLMLGREQSDAILRQAGLTPEPQG